ncbi:MAG: hypothetical protein ACOYOS_20950 [Syntrophales bacterium]
MAGSFVMLFVPIFQRLAIVMMFSAVGATVLTLIAVPLLYFKFFQNKQCPMAKQMGVPERLKSRHKVRFFGAPRGRFG